ncbi:uncharacterized protein BYT42DRAFT_489954 [Radiomyces spectabilis]|uniref:uncharacterized protein n=1 Tax=Radiomyces spectabilis TaxID=64574 RepID=UPI00221EDE24|nr:uncharacterized protein BYT42DRAFT_489954 [Radiomyces spectabilis]KAI8391742.1 hypothetical protein BYT42DRAFT_489954 [Radiomyces spectabilis]
MARIFTNSIYYVHEKSAMVALNDDIPVAQPKVQADNPEVFQQNMQELATDLVKKAKEIDALIEILPGIKHTEEEQVRFIHRSFRLSLDLSFFDQDGIFYWIFRAAH